jgi:hypothetical protein
MCSSLSTSPEDCQWCTASFCGYIIAIRFGVAIESVAYVLRALTSLVAEFCVGRMRMCVCVRARVFSVLAVTPATYFHVDISDMRVYVATVSVATDRDCRTVSGV